METTQVQSEPIRKPFVKKSPKVISLVNNKGGVFKTTLAFNLAKQYLRSNKRVTTVDFDQQGNLSQMLPEITQSGGSAEDFSDIEADYIIVDTGPTFVQRHIQLMLNSSIIIIPFHLERLDIEQSTSMLNTTKALGVTDKVKLIIIHSGTHTQMYKTLKPYADGVCEEYGVEVLCEMKKSQAVPKANLVFQTVFDIQSPPEIRREFKNLFSQVGQCLAN